MSRNRRDEYKPYPLNLDPFERRESIRWQTQDGQRMFIKEMTNSHLQNAINYLKRQNRFIPLRMLQEEQIIREILHKEDTIRRRNENQRNQVSIDIETIWRNTSTELRTIRF